MNFATQIILLAASFISISVFAQTSFVGNASESFFTKNQKFDNEGIELYTSNVDMKRHKKIGLGLSVGGASGAIGFNSELNLEPENALVIGLGAGPNYGTFNLMYKRNFESNYLSPYGKLGYSKWFSAAGNTSSFGTSDLLKNIFSEQELKSGRFDTDMMITSVGAEYNQLEGEMSGINFYGELVMMTQVKSARVVPSGAVGMIYFY